MIHNVIVFRYSAIFSLSANHAGLCLSFSRAFPGTGKGLIDIHVLCCVKTRVSSCFSWGLDCDDIAGTYNRILGRPIIKGRVVPYCQNPHCVVFQCRSRNARSPETNQYTKHGLFGRHGLLAVLICRSLRPVDLSSPTRAMLTALCCVLC